MRVLLKHNATFAPSDFPLKEDELQWYNEQKGRIGRENIAIIPVDQLEPANAPTQQRGNSSMLESQQIIESLLQQAEMQLRDSKNELAIIRQESNQYQAQLEQSRSLVAQQQTQLTVKDQKLKKYKKKIRQTKQQLAQRDQIIRDLQSGPINESLPNPNRNKESKCFS
jgi:uncharacterized protein (DUF3084 family)